MKRQPIKRKIKTLQNKGILGVKKNKNALGRTKRRKIGKSPLRKLKLQLEALQKQVVIKIYGRDCYTCPRKNLQGADCQLGHVPWPRSYLSTECKYDYRYTRIQCFRDNIHLGGLGAVALERMRQENIDVMELNKLNEATKGLTYSKEWFVTKIAEYQEILHATE